MAKSIITTESPTDQANEPIGDGMKMQLIESAPMDRSILLYWPSRQILNKKFAVQTFNSFYAVGSWDFDFYGDPPSPYWGCDVEKTRGTRWHRKHPPTQWCDLPASMLDLSPKVNRDDAS